MPGPDYILDLSSLKPDGGDDGDGDDAGLPAPGHSLRGRPWLAIRWRCCSVYSRVYRNRQGTAYDARCPRCGRPVHVKVGDGGTESRFFEAS